MATTTNYGWETPDDTDLVKDGALASRTLGSSIDTTVKNLNPETTLGDISYRSSTANVNTRLALGTAGQVLSVNSGATAPEWANVPSGGMTLINTGGTTLSGASITVGSIPATYNHLQIIIRNPLPATDGEINLRVNGDTGSNYAFTTSNDVTNISAASSSWQGGDQQDNTTGTGIAVWNIFDYANTTSRKMANIFAIYNSQGGTPTNFNMSRYFYYYNSNNAINSVTVFPARGGNFTSGTIFVYGVK